jgi:hypothetical protein
MIGKLNNLNVLGAIKAKAPKQDSLTVALRHNIYYASTDVFYAA